uniref:Peptidyl-prolyl cis-trans isomerase n=1 Tax=Oryza punctata TaxID=4537 RepID=A0A0E0LXY9_ORYPU
MDPRSKSDKIVRRTAMIGAATAAYFLLTADYGPDHPNPIRKAMEASPQYIKHLSIFKYGPRNNNNNQENAEPEATKDLPSVRISPLLARAARRRRLPRRAQPKMWGSADGGTPEVTLETSMGAFTIEMYYKHAPKTCRNFLELSRRGYYDNVIFHRIIKDFIVQGGDPTGTGRGGESIYGAKFEDEIRPELKHTGAGILSMANAGPNTNGSQFFITLAPCQSLDGKHTIFGRVSKGMEIVKRLGSVQTDKSDRPIHEVKILRTVVKD